MKKEQLQQMIDDIKQLEWLNERISELSKFSEKLAGHCGKCTVDISFKEKEEKVTLDEYGDLNYGGQNNNSTGFFFFSSPSINKDPRQDEKYFNFDTNEIVSMKIIQFLHNGMMLEQGKLLKRIEGYENKTTGI